MSAAKDAIFSRPVIPLRLRRKRGLSDAKAVLEKVRSSQPGFQFQFPAPHAQVQNRV